MLALSGLALLTIGQAPCVLLGKNGCNPKDGTDNWSTMPVDVADPKDCREALREWTGNCEHHVSATYDGQQLFVQSGAKYTSMCSHVRCTAHTITKTKDNTTSTHKLIHVRHNHHEEYGNKHVCALGLHDVDRCGCECYDEAMGDFMDDLLNQLSDEAARIGRVNETEIVSFSPTPSPTPSPTSSPTPLPTASPTTMPTAVPTSTPTKPWPTPAPTPLPVVSTLEIEMSVSGEVSDSELEVFRSALADTLGAPLDQVKLFVVEDERRRLKAGGGTTIRGEVSSTSDDATETLKEKAQSNDFAMDFTKKVQEQEQFPPLIVVEAVEVCGGDGEKVCASGKCNSGFFQRQVFVEFKGAPFTMPCAKSDGYSTTCPPDAAEAAKIQPKIQITGPCSESKGHFKHAGRYVLYCPIQPTVTVKNSRSTNWDPLTFSNEAGQSMVVDGVYHWSWNGNAMYLLPAAEWSNATKATAVLYGSGPISVSHYDPSVTATPVPAFTDLCEACGGDGMRKCRKGAPCAAHTAFLGQADLPGQTLSALSDFRCHACGGGGQPYCAGGGEACHVGFVANEYALDGLCQPCGGNGEHRCEDGFNGPCRAGLAHIGQAASADLDAAKLALPANAKVKGHYQRVCRPCGGAWQPYCAHSAHRCAATFAPLVTIHTSDPDAGLGVCFPCSTFAHTTTGTTTRRVACTHPRDEHSCTAGFAQLAQTPFSKLPKWLQEQTEGYSPSVTNALSHDPTEHQPEHGWYTLKVNDQGALKATTDTFAPFTTQAIRLQRTQPDMALKGSWFRVTEITAYDDHGDALTPVGARTDNYVGLWRKSSWALEELTGGSAKWGDGHAVHFQNHATLWYGKNVTIGTLKMQQLGSSEYANQNWEWQAYRGAFKKSYGLAAKYDGRCHLCGRNGSPLCAAQGEGLEAMCAPGLVPATRDEDEQPYLSGKCVLCGAKDQLPCRSSDGRHRAFCSGGYADAGVTFNAALLRVLDLVETELPGYFNATAVNTKAPASFMCSACGGNKQPACADDVIDGEPCRVTLFEDQWQEGWSRTFAPGDYATLPAFEMSKDIAPRVRSVTVSGRCEVTLFAGSNFTGMDHTFTESRNLDGGCLRQCSWKSGPCNYCGAGNRCCKKGHKGGEKGCGVEEGGKHHRCTGPGNEVYEMMAKVHSLRVRKISASAPASARPPCSLGYSLDPSNMDGVCRACGGNNQPVCQFGGSGDPTNKWCKVGHAFYGQRVGRPDLEKYRSNQGLRCFTCGGQNQPQCATGAACADGHGPSNANDGRCYKIVAPNPNTGTVHMSMSMTLAGRGVFAAFTPAKQEAFEAVVAQWLELQPSQVSVSATERSSAFFTGMGVAVALTPDSPSLALHASKLSQKPGLLAAISTAVGLPGWQWLEQLSGSGSGITQGCDVGDGSPALMVKHAATSCQTALITSHVHDWYNMPATWWDGAVVRMAVTDYDDVAQCQRECASHRECAGVDVLHLTQGRFRCYWKPGRLLLTPSKWMVRQGVHVLSRDCYLKVAPSPNAPFHPRSQTKVDFSKPRLRATFTAPTGAQCEDVCSKHPQCAVATWFEQSDVCWLSQHTAPSAHGCRGTCQSFVKGKETKPAATGVIEALPTLAKCGSRATNATACRLETVANYTKSLYSTINALYYDDRSSSEFKACASEDGTDIFTDCGDSAGEHNPIARGQWTFQVASSKGAGYNMVVHGEGLYSNQFFIVRTVRAGEAASAASPEIEKALSTAQKCKAERGVAGVKAIYQWDVAASRLGRFVQTLHCSDIPMRIASKSFEAEVVRMGNWDLTLRGSAYTSADWGSVRFYGRASGFFVKAIASNGNTMADGLQEQANICGDLGHTGLNALFTTEGRLVRNLGCASQEIIPETMQCTGCTSAATDAPTPAPTPAPTLAPTRNPTRAPTMYEMPCTNGAFYEGKCPDDPVEKAKVQLRIETRSKCTESSGHSAHVGKVVLRCPLQKTVDVRNGNNNVPMVLTNQHGDSFKVDGVYHWAWKAGTMFLILPHGTSVDQANEVMYRGGHITFAPWQN